MAARLHAQWWELHAMPQNYGPPHHRHTHVRQCSSRADRVLTAQEGGLRSPNWQSGNQGAWQSGEIPKRRSDGAVETVKYLVLTSIGWDTGRAASRLMHPRPWIGAHSGRSIRLPRSRLAGALRQKCHWTFISPLSPTAARRRNHAPPAVQAVDTDSADYASAVPLPDETRSRPFRYFR